MAFTEVGDLAKNRRNENYSYSILLKVDAK